MSDLLKHYGILGMKWGIRRTPEQLARARGVMNESGKISRELRGISGRFRPKASAATKSRVSKMSDDDLRKSVARMNLERSYLSLSGNDVSRGQERFDRILDVTAGVLAIGSSSVAIAMALKAKRLSGN